MTAESVERALAAAQGWLLIQDAPESVIVAHEGGVAESQEGARRWVRRILDDQDQGGAWGGELLDTSAALLTIQEIRSAAGVVEREPEINRGLDWVRDRQNVSGAWTDGCTPDRHERGTCHHFMGGFFSPGPPEVPYEEGWLRAGLRLAGDAEVRFVASVLALRCLMAWSEGGADVRLHLAGLRRLLGGWDDHVPAGLSTGSLLAAIQALLLSPEPEDRSAAEGGLRIVGGRQRGDGSWVDADAFQALEVFGAAVDADVFTDRSRRALWHGARLLTASQQRDGSWGKAYGPRRALIAWRTFRRLDPELE
ncbi:MAG TPA: hypothetical protein VMM12_07405 [Longimicrobiales bacterium]|nr:hypothetical protein [Longimicrobiales bacterium]